MIDSSQFHSIKSAMVLECIEKLNNMVVARLMASNLAATKLIGPEFFFAVGSHTIVEKNKSIVTAGKCLNLSQRSLC